MNAAAYVGRVGGLAVALGVGAAVVSGYGVAWADPTESGPSTSESSESSDPAASSNPDTGPDISIATTESDPSTTTTKTDSDNESETPSTAASTDSLVRSAPPGEVLATGGVVKSGTTSDNDEPTKSPAPATPTATATPTPEAAEPAPATPTAEPKPDPDASTASPPQRSAAKIESAFAPPTSTVDAAEVVVDGPEPLSGDADDDAQVTVTAATLTRTASIAAVEGAPVARLQSVTPAPEVEPQNPAQFVSGVVSSIVSLALSPFAGATPTAPAEPPTLWGLLAWVRREFEQALSGSARSTALGSSPVATGPAGFALTTAEPAMALAAAAAPAFPVPGAQLSPSTTFVNWLTGNWPPNNTLDRFAISGTDLGIMWDNGIWDDPTTGARESQVLIAFGDTFGDRLVPGEEWRNNVLFRSWDRNLTDGISVADGVFGDIWAGAPLDRVQWEQFHRTFAKQAVPNANLGPSITIIPTAGISVPRAGAPFEVMQVMHFMAVQQWGNPGQWSTSYSALATSLDNGESWQVAPQTVRYNQWWTGNQNFQQAAFVRPGDGFVYMYGTPNGRQGSAYVSRVLEKDILDLTKYEYYRAAQPGWFGTTPAGWVRNNPAAATAVMPPQGACPGTGPGNTVSEMSVQYNKSLNKFVALYADQFNNVVIRTASQPEGTWSEAKVLIPQQSGGIYAPYMHPWSPSTLGTGTDLYWTLSHWGEYNVMLMRTDMTRV